MKKVAVIGCGWLGLPLAIELKAKGYEVYGFARREEVQNILKTNDIVVLPSADSLENIDVAICTLTPPKTEEDLELHTKIAQAATDKEVTQFIYTSSISVYPDIEAEVSEDDFDPNHAISQLEATYRGQYPKTTILRLGGLYGGDRHPAKYLSGRASVAKPLAPINLVSRERVIDSILKCIELDIQAEIINVVDKEHPTRVSYYTEICKQLGIAPPMFEDSVEKGKIVSTKKMEQLLHL
jgi:nucleoside-diphosphate-sugar epimerase